MLMKEEEKEAKLGWVWRCASKCTKKKGDKSCRAIKNPATGTFFDGTQCHLEICEVSFYQVSFI